MTEEHANPSLDVEAQALHKDITVGRHNRDIFEDDILRINDFPPTP